MYVVQDKLKNKKSQGISINVIIIAAIALIILVVLVAVFTGRFGIFTEGVKGAAGCDKGCKALNYESGELENNCAGRIKLPGYSEGVKSCCCKSK